jgi:uncharacterized protein
MNINQKIAEELSVTLQQVNATVALLDEDLTVPFIARYRKEVTGSLTDTQLRQLEERLIYLRELEERRAAILESVDKQGKLTPELKTEIEAADNKARLEDLYLPYKPKRRTKAQIAKEAGLEPLADSLLLDPSLDPIAAAKNYIDEEKNISTVESALEGARHILMERFSENADLINQLREYVWQNALLSSVVIKDKEEEGAKFKDYFNYQEPIKKVPSHRALAVLRGQKEEILRASVAFASEDEDKNCVQMISKCFAIQNKNRAADAWLLETVEWTWKIKLKLKIEVDLILRLREASELEAIKVFKENLKNLLMAAPAGGRITMGLDPGFRTGVKVVVVNDTGKLLDYTVIFPHAPQNEWDNAIEKISKLCRQYQVDLVSIGNGTASRETDRLMADVIKRYPDLKLTKVVVSEAGASVYSASQLAADEFPKLDVTYRGAVSIARRLHDPLAELVKIDPKAIGVGQYQHDVNQIKLGASLHAVVEDCVNAVGADVNTASVPLLKNIAGLNESVAQNIVNYREANGRFQTRTEIKKVPRLGEKTYEQAIGFLRIIGGKNPLDASAVHPEAYPVVEKIIEKSGQSINALMGNSSTINSLKPQDFVDEKFGLPTVKDILSELQKPGRDPRPEFKVVEFLEGVETLEDLKPDMVLEGVVTNVTNFGAFVDIGVHQDGLVHVSQLANRYIADPNEIVKVGQHVKVKVQEIDVRRKRIQLTMRLEGNSKTETKKTQENVVKNVSEKKSAMKKTEVKVNSGFADALSSALQKK